MRPWGRVALRHASAEWRKLIVPEEGDFLGAREYMRLKVLLGLPVAMIGIGCIFLAGSRDHGWTVIETSIGAILIVIGLLWLNVARKRI